MDMDVGKPIKESVGPQAEVAGRDGSKLMRAVESVMLAGVALKLAEDLSGPKMQVGSPILEVAGGRGEVVGNSRGDLLRTVVAESMIIGAFSLAQDLAAINIQRGRDLGLGRLNETREAIGLDPYTDFDQITDDTATVAALRKAFKDVDAVDLWTGGLAEKLVSGAFVGETFQKIIAHQFDVLRSGDRLWFENQGLDAETLAEIKSTKLCEIIERNTLTEHIQDDVFTFSERRGASAGGVTRPSRFARMRDC